MGKADRTFSALVMVFVLGFLGLGYFHYAYEWTILRFPFVVGLFTCLLCVADMLKGLHGGKAVPVSNGSSNGSAGDDAGEGPLTLRQAWPAMCWVAAIVPFVFVLGYVIGLPLYVLVYLRAHEQGWVLSTALSLCTLAVIYLGFVKLLGVRFSVLPLGLF